MNRLLVSKNIIPKLNKYKLFKFLKNKKLGSKIENKNLLGELFLKKI